MVKRKGNLISSLCNISNILIADSNARKAKKRSKRFIEKHDQNIIDEDMAIAVSFYNLSYKTSPYVTYKIYEPKERLIYRLPYYPDRIAHHAIMNIVKDYWTKQFISNTYSCIEGRGIHKCLTDLKGKELLQRQLKIVKKLKGKIIQETNREMEMFRKFREFSKTHPEVTYEEFIKASM